MGNSVVTSNDSIADGCPVQHTTAGDSMKSPASETADGCPVDHTKSMSGFNSLVNDYSFSNERTESSQQTRLSQKRVVSSIPRGSYKPTHQPAHSVSDNWVYPSEQQYYNAMRRKGYSPQERDMSVVLLIHNLVNEQGWAQIKEWENYRGNDQPKLLRFTGRPNDISPKAWILSRLFGYKAPFDRHDWVVERNGKQVRYVIDFYQGARSTASSPVSVYLDVRPALDSTIALVDRLTFNLRRQFAPSSLPPACLESSPFFRMLQKDATDQH